MPPTKDEFRKAMGRFATGVTIVTTGVDGEVHGMTANAVTSVSLEPMMILLCADKGADSHDILSRAGVFAVNILSEDQEEISDRFANKETGDAHGLDGVPHRIGKTGAPILEGTLAYVDCRTVSEQDAGDHTIFIGEVVDAGFEDDGSPLLFFGGQYGRMA
ncbi:MAG: flavin reductase family protein [Chloroflexi bacterium]|nr:flavin reductase family protein [Chloroflexota bacterium]